MDQRRIILVTRKTRLEGLVERFNTREQAKFYIEHSGEDFGYYEREHEVYRVGLEILKAQLSRVGRLHVIERSFLPAYLFAADDLVVTLGIDGQVVNTAKYLDGQLLIAVNPDPAHIDGILLPFRVDQAEAAARKALDGGARLRQICMAEARLADGQRLLAFNDFFVGAKSHVSARYQLKAGQFSERQSSSGIIVSTGVGATGWLSSLFNMASGMSAAFGGATSPLQKPELAWESDRLVYVVREPFISKTSSAGLVCGLIPPGEALVVQSEMPSGGVIFSDGVENDFLAFNSGTTAEIRLAQKKTLLVVK
jgi:NAD kinase